MNIENSIINPLLKDLSFAVKAAKRDNVLIDLQLKKDVVYCVSVNADSNKNIAKIIDLHDGSAQYQLTACINSVYAITPSKINEMQVVA